MKSKKEIVKDWITRYTGIELDSFGNFILLTNFQKYVDEFAKLNKVKVDGKDKNMPSATYQNITIINFGMGSPNAATVMDLLFSIKPKAVLFLGKCGGLKKRINIGDFILPIGAIRAEGTSNDYFPIEVPADALIFFTESYFLSFKISES
jgi:AMP nucleosidase